MGIGTLALIAAIVLVIACVIKIRAQDGNMALVLGLLALMCVLFWHQSGQVLG